MITVEQNCVSEGCVLSRFDWKALKSGTVQFELEWKKIVYFKLVLKNVDGQSGLSGWARQIDAGQYGSGPGMLHRDPLEY